jgi:hypothetical protein
MPDFWETATGSNINTNDAMTLGGDGYRFIEKYINWLGDPHANTVNNTYVDIDLWKFTGAFTNVSPTYAISNVSNGTAVLQANGHTVRFTPTTNFTGLGSFKFTVTGSDGSVYSNTVSVVVSTLSATILLAAPAALTGLESNEATVGSGLLVYPNPTTSAFLNFKLANAKGTSFTVVLSDRSGKTIYEKTMAVSSGDKYDIRLPKKPAAGSYLLQVTGNGWKESTNVLIE